MNAHRAMKSLFCFLQIGWVVCLLALLGDASLLAATGTRGYSGTQIFSTVGGDKDEGEPNHCGEPGGASSWFFYKAPRSGVMMVDTKGSSFDTVLAVYIGPGTGYATLTNIACNNDSSPGNLWSKVVFNVTSNTMYYIAVDGVGGASGTVKLNYMLNDPLLITQQPQGLVQVAGQSASFNVAATGAPPLTYQWFYYDQSINGATQTMLTLPAVQLSHEGLYTAIVKDAISEVQSASVPLTVCAQAPGTNCVNLNQITMNGAGYTRVTGHAAAGSVLEASENLVNWVPLHTNSSSQPLFTFDEPMGRPQRYFRVRLAP